MNDDVPQNGARQPLQLQYADREYQYGITLERWPGGLRITIPPRFFKFLLPATVIELDPSTLHLQGMTNQWDEGKTGLMDRPRGAVYEVKAVSHSGNLFIKAHGHDFIERRPHRDPKVVQWIADRLNDELGFVARTGS